MCEASCFHLSSVHLIAALYFPCGTPCLEVIEEVRCLGKGCDNSVRILVANIAVAQTTE